MPSDYILVHIPMSLSVLTTKMSVNIEKAANDASGNNVYYLRRLHNVHPSNAILNSEGCWHFHLVCILYLLLVWVGQGEAL